MTRRANGSGTVFCVPHRRLPWCAAIVVGWTPTGRTARRVRYAATEPEARRLLAVMVSGRIPPKANARQLVAEGPPRQRRTHRSSDVPASLRFLVLQRDGFACTYCGRRPPDTTLEVDHVIPRSKGGATDLANLTTACWECNAGKSDL